MICPHCKTEITEVRLYSQHYRVGEIGALGGNKVLYYSRAEFCDETTDIECPECAGDLTEHIEE